MYTVENLEKYYDENPGKRLAYYGSLRIDDNVTKKALLGIIMLMGEDARYTHEFHNESIRELADIAKQAARRGY